MKHASTNELYLYWNRLRKTRSAPDRSLIEPADIRSVLKDTFILSVEDEATYSFRLAGTRTCSLFGSELKGQNILSLMDGESREAVQTLLHTTCQDCTANVVGMIGKNEIGQSIPLEILILPLKLNGRTDKRILGTIAPLKVPNWAGLQPIQTLQLASLRMIMPHQHKVEICRPLAIGDEPGAPLAAMEGRQVGHLTVLEGGLR